MPLDQNKSFPQLFNTACYNYCQEPFSRSCRLNGERRKVGNRSYAKPIQSYIKPVQK